MELTTREKRILYLVLDYAIQINRSVLRDAAGNGDKALAALKANDLAFSHGLSSQDLLDSLETYDLEDADYTGGAHYNTYLDTTDYLDGNEESLSNVFHMRVCQKLWRRCLTGHRTESTSDALIHTECWAAWTEVKSEIMTEVVARGIEPPPLPPVPLSRHKLKAEVECMALTPKEETITRLALDTAAHEGERATAALKLIESLRARGITVEDIMASTVPVDIDEESTNDDEGDEAAYRRLYAERQAKAVKEADTAARYAAKQLLEIETLLKYELITSSDPLALELWVAVVTLNIMKVFNIKPTSPPPSIMVWEQNVVKRLQTHKSMVRNVEKFLKTHKLIN